MLEDIPYFCGFDHLGHVTNLKTYVVEVRLLSMVEVMTSPKRFQQTVASQSKDFAWRVPASSDSLMTLLSDEEKTKIASKQFSDELKFDVPVDLEGSKHAFIALKEGLETKGSISKAFTEMKQLDPSNLVDPLNLGDNVLADITS